MCSSDLNPNAPLCDEELRKKFDGAQTLDQVVQWYSDRGFKVNRMLELMCLARCPTRATATAPGSVKAAAVAGPSGVKKDAATPPPVDSCQLNGG